jgi:3-oxocholest-4-en-26-oyl-CoA dehydrogenase beta subunit
MNPTLSETQVLLSASMRDYLSREVASKKIHELEANGESDRELWSYLNSAGYLQLPFSVELGGQGGSLTDLGVLVEELARRPATVPLVETMASALALPGSLDDTRAVIEAVMRGVMTISPAIVERRGSATATLAESGSVTGEKHFVDYGASTSHHLVAAGTPGDEGLFLVDVSDPGVTIQPVPTIAKTPTALVRYERAAAKKVGGAEAHQRLISLGRILASVQCLGHSQRALDLTIEYVGVRVQFGRPIGQFQAVQHHVANMATMVTAARFLIYEALWKLETGIATPEDIATAKAWASKTATEVPMMAHQLHGGIGVTNDYDLQFLSRRGKERAVSWGTAEECLRLLSGSLVA